MYEADGCMVPVSSMSQAAPGTVGAGRNCDSHTVSCPTSKSEDKFTSGFKSQKRCLLYTSDAADDLSVV